MDSGFIALCIASMGDIEVEEARSGPGGCKVKIFKA